MKVVSKKLLGILATSALLGTTTNAAEATINLNPSADASLKNEVSLALDRGLAWLATHQEQGGWWSNDDHPAVSALALTAFMGDPSGHAQKKYAEQIEKGYQFLLANAHEDGSIYRKEALLNYNTSVSLKALTVANNPEYEDVIRKARNFVIGLQWDLNEPGKIDSNQDGGIGYGSSNKNSDLSNTILALEALYYSKHIVEDKPQADTKELDWNAAISFLENCQNLPSHNQNEWASDDPANKGGFIYSPGISKAGEMKLEDGRTALRSYGSISYAGLLSYVYADLKRDDPRVLAVYDWLQKNYTLAENPGMDQQGLFYYYHTMAKALNLYGLDELTLADGTTTNWRHNLALHLIQQQKSDGHWINPTARWMENDPALVTSYTVLALQQIHSGL